MSFSVDVVAYPCPSIKWTFNGTLLTVNDNIVFNNPCMEYSENLQLNWTFTLNVTVLNTTSGSYSAELIMNHTNETIQLPKPLYITIPGMYADYHHRFFHELILLLLLISTHFYYWPDPE